MLAFVVELLNKELDTHVKSKINVIVDIASNQKKNELKYLSFTNILIRISDAKTTLYFLIIKFFF